MQARGKPGDGLGYPGGIGMYSLHGFSHLKRLFGAIQLFENHRKPRKRPKMARVQRQGLANIGQGRADLAQLIIGRGPRVPTFGKIRSVIDQRGEMFNRQRQLPRRHGLAPAFQQKVHRGRSGFRPFDPDFLFDSPRPFGIGGLQPVKQIIQFDALAKGSRSTEDQRQKCRNDKVVKLCPNFHNRKVAYGAENSSPRRITMERWMSEVISAAVAALAAKMSDGFSAGIAKFVIPGHGAIMIDADGARAGDDEADVTLTAEADVFRAILEGEMNPTAAFMTGKLTVDGSMGLAMQLGAALA